MLLRKIGCYERYANRHEGQKCHANHLGPPPYRGLSRPGQHLGTGPRLGGIHPIRISRGSFLFISAPPSVVSPMPLPRPTSLLRAVSLACLARGCSIAVLRDGVSGRRGFDCYITRISIGIAEKKMATQARDQRSRAGLVGGCERRGYHARRVGRAATAMRTDLVQGFSYQPTKTALDFAILRRAQV